MSTSLWSITTRICADVLWLLSCMTSGDRTMFGMASGCIESLGLRGVSGVSAHWNQRVDFSSCFSSCDIGLYTRLFCRTFEIYERFECLSARGKWKSSTRKILVAGVSQSQGRVRVTALMLSERKFGSGATIYVIVWLIACAVAVCVSSTCFSIISFQLIESGRHLCTGEKRSRTCNFSISGMTLYQAQIRERLERHLHYQISNPNLIWSVRPSSN